MFDIAIAVALEAAELPPCLFSECFADACFFFRVVFFFFVVALFAVVVVDVWSVDDTPVELFDSVVEAGY